MATRLGSVHVREFLEDRLSVPRSTGLTGAAGEYFVAAELSLQGWLATVTIKNAPGTDVLAQRVLTGQVVAIQTKTASFGNQFQLNAKAEMPATTENEWFVFVKLHEELTRPTFYVVPKDVVAASVYAQHREWLSRPGRKGQPHRDSAMRQVRAKHIDGYRERWDLLDKPTSEAPLLVHEWYREVVTQFGFPPGHPGWPDQRDASRPPGLDAGVYL